MHDFCPLIKDKCKKNECVMFKDEKCLISYSMMYYICSHQVDDEYKEPEGKKVPIWLEKATKEDMANEMISFIRKRDEMDFENAELYEEFWKSKNIDETWDLPEEIQKKMDKAEDITQKQLMKEAYDRLAKREKKEREELPTLINSCVTWANEQGLKRLTNSDVTVFLLDNKIEILDDTKRFLYSKANLELKTKH